MQKVTSMIIFIVLFALSGCGDRNNTKPVSSVLSRSPSGGAGVNIADTLTKNYNNTPEDCGGERQPAFLCSGVILRNTGTSTSYHHWDPSPQSVRSGGVSFSYLRKDIRMSELASAYARNGFLLYPEDETPPDMGRYMEVLCMFPVDGGTDIREDAGCGTDIRYPQKGRACQQQGITTAEGWVEHFKNAPVKNDFDEYQYQCGFETKKNSPYNIAQGFYQGGIATQAVEKMDIYRKNNELRIRTWKTDQPGYPANFPVSAFFYISQNNDVPSNSITPGLPAAQYDQSDFYQQTGRWVPVIKLTLPASPAENAKFEFSEADQKIPEFKALVPQVLEAKGDNGRLLRQTDYYDLLNLTVDVPVYPGMAAGDVVSVHWEGLRHTYHTASRTVSALGTLHFSIPRIEFLDTIGDTARLSFSVTRAGRGPVVDSGILPLRVEEQDLQLPAPIASSDLKVITVQYAGMTAGQQVTVRLEGTTTYDTPPQRIGTSGAISFAIPTRWLNENGEKPMSIYYLVGDTASGGEQFSHILRTTVPKRQISDFSPQVLEARGEGGLFLRQADYYSLPNLTVDVPVYPGITAGDIVSIRWEGPRHTYNTASRTVTARGTLHFSIPRVEFLDTIGNTAQVSFSVMRAGSMQEENSDTLPLRVEGQSLSLPTPAINANQDVVTVKYNGMTIHDRIFITMVGKITYWTWPRYGNTSGEVIFKLPERWLDENREKQVAVNYAVERYKADKYCYSPYRRITIFPAVIPPGKIILHVEVEP